MIAVVKSSSRSCPAFTQVAMVAAAVVISCCDLVSPIDSILINLSCVFMAGKSAKQQGATRIQEILTCKRNKYLVSL